MKPIHIYLPLNKPKFKNKSSINKICIVWHVCFYLRQKHKLLILSRLSDFMTCSERFNIYSEGSISQLWNTV